MRLYCCDAASAETEATTTQAASTHRAQPVHLDIPSYRHLRAAETAAAKVEDEEEERMFEHLTKLLHPTGASRPRFVGKVTEQDGTFTVPYVNFLLKKENKDVRLKLFEDHAKWDEEGKELIKALGKTEEGVRLFRKYEKFIGLNRRKVNGQERHKPPRTECTASKRRIFHPGDKELCKTAVNVLQRVFGSVLPPALNASVMTQYGEMTTGTSGRDIAKMMIYCHAKDEVRRDNEARGPSCGREGEGV
ncbi:hypothetical protein PHYSODRAFT_295772 [Phytophthora sojae]|uniref:RxLR effector protein n=1 Tax=Phytophthora sojae (strain P6497) TaxID=1094619 RepID=G4YZW7_PHYSP|nr:hypothetical protein PHYSODRAFT_295772 [Phytophthora sojae]EGZ23330.1 hypothetical protein PHYSODRAFT_295772 [Phytophthora sojae]|eukprot:XP_009518618.1 hypothetical protein PHYSODRAFT_295772 [Phytophthora sojae]